MLVMDFETITSNTQYFKKNGDTRVILGCCYGMDIESYGYSIESGGEFLLTLPSCTIYFHNLNFDGNFILKSLKRFESKGNGKGCINNKIFSISFFYTLNRIYSIDIHFRQPKTKKSITLHIRDSYLLLRESVETLGEAIGINKFINGKDDKFYDYEPFNEENPVPEEFLNYCFRDCRIIYISLMEFFNFVNKLPSVSKKYLSLNKIATNIKKHYVRSLSYSSFFGKKKDFYEFDKLWYKTTSEEDWDLGYKFFKGAYSYINRNLQSSFIQNINGICYDINSAYGTIMNEEYLPLSCDLETAQKYGKDVKILEFYEIHVKKVYLIDSNFPFLFLHDGKQGFKYTSYLESCVLYYTKEEFEFLQNYYEFEIEKIYIHKKVGARILKQYAQTMFKNRQISKDYLHKQIYKSLLTSAYGDFSQRKVFDVYCELTEKYNINEIITFDDERYRVKQVKTGMTGLNAYLLEPLDLPKQFNNIGIASYITSKARLKLYEMIVKSPQDVIYVDTDSVFLKQDNRALRKMVSNDLGGLKIECEFDEMMILGIKRYVVFQQKKQIKHGFSGISKRGIKKSMFEDRAFGNVDSTYSNYRLDCESGLVFYTSNAKEYML